jgi:hypothetical protein
MSLCENKTLLLRFDVDYPYPSRQLSFLSVLLNKHPKRNYLRNSKIIAEMINQSPKPIKAYWFFTPHTIPDKELLSLLFPENPSLNIIHEIGLHVINHPLEELQKLQSITSQPIRFFTIHGTERLLGQLLWKRKIGQTTITPLPDERYANFQNYPTVSLDRFAYDHPDNALSLSQQYIASDFVLHMHPEWLFKSGTFNHRGRYYEAIQSILNIDQELNQLSTSKKLFFKTSRYTGAKDFEGKLPSQSLTTKMKNREIDIFTFSGTGKYTSRGNTKTTENIAMLQLSTYDKWLKLVGKKTRNILKKNNNITFSTTVNDAFFEGIIKIYNETPIRQGLPFPHYGETIANIDKNEACVWIGAYLDNELVGFVKLLFGDKIAVMSQIISLQKYWNKSINNFLIAKTVEFCIENKMSCLIYGRFGNHPSLDVFKRNNGFSDTHFTRFYIGLTLKGKLALFFKLHRDLKDILPRRIKEFILPAYKKLSVIKNKWSKNK